MADAKEQTFTETAYKTEAWHYRHAVVTGIILFFSIFYLAALGVFNACIGFITGVRDGWALKVKPFIDIAHEKVPDETTASETQSSIVEPGTLSQETPEASAESEEATAQEQKAL